MNDADVIRAAASALNDNSDVLGDARALRRLLTTTADVLERRTTAGGVPCTAGLFTREEVTTAVSAAVETVQAITNPDGGETTDTIYADTIADITATLALGLLDDPSLEPDQVIAAEWHDLDPDTGGFEVWNPHNTEAGEPCPWSGTPVADDTDAGPADERCPQGCHGSKWDNPAPGTPQHKAAIVATVKGWVE